MKSEGRVLALDYGRVRIGVAVSDPLQVIARGIGALPNDPSLWDRLAGIVSTEKVSLVVVGMPYAPDGGLGARGEEVSRFVQEVRERTGLPVETWDESQSSSHARAALRAAGMSRRKRREKGREDTMAARMILQEYLDAVRP